MFRIFVLLVDLSVLGYIIFMTIKEVPSSGEDIAVVTTIYSIFLINITYVFLSKTNKESWISLYFKRKALEEKGKIRALQDE